MSSNKRSWAQIAAGKTAKTPSAPKPANPSKPARQSSTLNPQAMVYQPLILPLAMLDIKCPRCKHKNHPIVLDNLADDERRPGCAECDVCFPSADAVMRPSASKRPEPAQTIVPIQTIDDALVAPLPGDVAELEASSIQQLPPDNSSATTESSGTTALIQQEDLLMPPRYINTFTGEQVALPPSQIQPDKDSPDFPNATFFRELKQKTRTALSAELFEGSIPDDTPKNRLGLQPPIETAASKYTTKETRSPTPRPYQDWRRVLSTKVENPPSIFHNFEEDLAREWKARMREG